MKVKMIPGGEIRTVEDSYGVRLIEQGRAVVAAEVKAPAAKTAKK